MMGAGRFSTRSDNSDTPTHHDDYEPHRLHSPLGHVSVDAITHLAHRIVHIHDYGHPKNGYVLRTHARHQS